MRKSKSLETTVVCENNSGSYFTAKSISRYKFRVFRYRIPSAKKIADEFARETLGPFELLLDTRATFLPCVSQNKRFRRVSDSAAKPASLNDWL